MSVFRREATRVAVVQSRIDQGDKPGNQARAEELLSEAAAQGAELVVMPEAYASGVNFIILRQMAEPVPDGPVCDRLRGLARAHGIHVVAGVLEAGDDGRVYDSAVAIDDRGELLATYRRRFLWVGERAYVAPGDEAVVVDTAVGRVGVIIGYDLSFPEACAPFLANDVDIIACPASVFDRLNLGARHLCLARAIDAHCHFMYANAIGFHQFANMRYTGGSGVFADPYFQQVGLRRPPSAGLGRVAEAGEDAEEAVVADIHLATLRESRTPALLPFKGDAAYTLGEAPAKGVRLVAPQGADTT